MNNENKQMLLIESLEMRQNSLIDIDKLLLENQSPRLPHPEGRG